MTPHCCAGDLPQAFSGADHGICQPGGAVEASRKILVCDVDVVVFVHRDLLDHDAAFRINVGRIDSSSGDHVPEDIDRERHVIGQDARVVTRAFLGGKCIEVAANLFDFGGNFEWPSSGGPLKEEMFKKMGCPSCFAGFVSRTNADPEAERD